MVLCLFGLYAAGAYTASKARHRRPATDERVHLVHADELRYDMYGGDAPGAQIVKGKVHFSHAGTHLWCDSAYFFQSTNSVKAFGHVRYKDGDTLSLSCNRAAYDGMTQTLTAREQVVLKHRRQTLYCDSLNYNRLEQYAYFFEGGKLVDGKDRLVSDWGGYHPDTRQAEFYYSVHMTNGERDIRTDTLYYDITKSMAHIVGPSTITSKTSKVKTTDAYFDTKSDNARMFSRSTVIDGYREITGDTLTHNDKSGVSVGYGNVIYKDKQHRNELLCGHITYNDKTGEGFASRNPVAIDYSQKDTLWMHSDSMKIYTYNINTDSAYRKVYCFPNVRAYRNDVQAICGLLIGNSADSCVTLYQDPIVWSGERQLLGDSIKLFMNDSTVREVDVLGQTLTVQKYDDKDHFNQVSSRAMYAYFTDGNLRSTHNVGNVCTVYFPVDDKDSTLIGLNYMETDTLVMHLSAERKMQKIISSKATGTLYPMTQIPPEKTKLPGFQWFTDLRPKDKNDIFRVAGKTEDQKLKPVERRAAPLQRL